MNAVTLDILICKRLQPYLARHVGGCHDGAGCAASHVIWTRVAVKVAVKRALAQTEKGLPCVGSPFAMRRGCVANGRIRTVDLRFTNCTVPVSAIP